MFRSCGRKVENNLVYTCGQWSMVFFRIPAGQVPLPTLVLFHRQKQQKTNAEKNHKKCVK